MSRQRQHRTPSSQSEQFVFLRATKTHQEGAINPWIFKEIVPYMSIIHPWRDQTHSAVPIFEIIYSVKWKQVWMRKLAPQNGFLGKNLKIVKVGIIIVALKMGGTHFQKVINMRLLIDLDDLETNLLIAKLPFPNLPKVPRGNGTIVFTYNVFKNDTLWV
jgi:hypothetical protein